MPIVIIYCYYNNNNIVIRLCFVIDFVVIITFYLFCAIITENYSVLLSLFEITKFIIVLSLIKYVYILLFNQWFC